MSSGSTEVELTEGLSQTQRAVVRSTERYLRVLAGAGAGKTETMTRRIVALLLRGEDPAGIVAFTFTERAAAEIKERIHLRGEEFLPKSVVGRLGDMFVGTIHAYCLQLLQDRYGYGSYEALDDNQEMAFLLREGWGLGLGKGGTLASSNFYAASCEEFLYSVEIVQNELLDRKALKRRQSKFASGLERYEALLDEHHILTFGRMVSLAVKRIEKDPRPIRQVRWLIVDEFQDVNKAQEQLIRLISRTSSCFVVGDPRQCVYGWRGSDPSCFNRFAKEHKAPTIALLENYRSGREIVRLGNSISSQFDERDLRQEMEEMRPVEGKLTYAELENPACEAEWIADQIQALTKQGVCSPGHVAILLRSIKTSGEPIIQALRARRIRHIVGGNLGLFGRQEAIAVGAIFVWLGGLTWKSSPWSNDEVANEDLPELASQNWPAHLAKGTLMAWRKEVLGARKPAFRNLSAAYHDLLKRLGVGRWDPRNLEAAVRLSNLGRFNSLLNDFEAARRRGGRPFRPDRDLPDLAWFIKTQGLSGYEEQSRSELGDVDAVKVMTIHQAKGLEWPIVFVPALVKGRFPGTRVGSERSSWVPRNLYDTERYSGSVEDERKVFYVACTRARDGLALSRFQKMTNRRSPSPFLEELKLPFSALPPEPFIDKVELKMRPEEEVISFSPGEIIDYRRCPQKYHFGQDWGYQAGVVHELGYGKAVHHVLHEVALAAKEGRDPLTILDKILDEGFHMPYLSPGLGLARKATAKKIIVDYIQKHRTDFSHIEEIEARMEFRLAKFGNVMATVKGRVDVIHAPDGSRELRDYKTMDLGDAKKEKQREALEDSTFQIQTYALGERALERPVAKASVAFLNSGSLEPVPITENDLALARDGAVAAVEGILSGQFPGKPGAQCKKCDFKVICRYCDKSAKVGAKKKTTS